MLNLNLLLNFILNFWHAETFLAEGGVVKMFHVTVFQSMISTFSLSTESGQFNTDKTVLSSDKFHKCYQHSWEVRREANSFKKSIKHYNETVMSFSTAEEVLIWMKWQTQKSQFFHFFMLSNLTSFELRLSVTTDR